MGIPDAIPCCGHMVGPVGACMLGVIPTQPCLCMGALGPTHLFRYFPYQGGHYYFPCILVVPCGLSNDVSTVSHGFSCPSFGRACQTNGFGVGGCLRCVTRAAILSHHASPHIDVGIPLPSNPTTDPLDLTCMQPEAVEASLGGGGSGRCLRCVTLSPSWSTMPRPTFPPSNLTSTPLEPDLRAARGGGGCGRRRWGWRHSRPRALGRCVPRRHGRRSV